MSLGAANSYGVAFSIDKKTSYMYECNGTWSPIKNLSMKFEILKVLNSVDSSWIYHLMVSFQVINLFRQSLILFRWESTRIDAEQTLETDEL